ncbi:hypothetical protein V8F06_001031 [Rhypophila decipiens]
MSPSAPRLKMVVMLLLALVEMGTVAPSVAGRLPPRRKRDIEVSSFIARAVADEPREMGREQNEFDRQDAHLKM